MGRYDRDEVLARVDLPDLADSLLGPRHPRTRSWRCPNPSHPQTGRTPPVSIFTSQRGEQRWHCHGCGAGGTAIDLVLDVGQARDFREALEWLAQQANVPPGPDNGPRPARPTTPAQRPSGPDEAARRALTAYVDACVAHLHSGDGREVLRWLTETRAIPLEVVRHVGVGADPGWWNLPRPRGIPEVSPAAVFPVRRRDGDVIFTLSRVLRPMGDLPRWLNTRSSLAPNPRLALLDPPGPPRAGPIIVTEGMLDALSALSAARPAAALLGTGIIDDNVADRLAKLRRPILLATDNDTAGQHARGLLTTLLHDRSVTTAPLPIPERYNDLNDWHTASRDHWPTTLTATIKLATAGLGHRGPSASLRGIA